MIYAKDLPKIESELERQRIKEEKKLARAKQKALQKLERDIDSVIRKWHGRCRSYEFNLPLNYSPLCSSDCFELLDRYVENKALRKFVPAPGSLIIYFIES